MPCKGCNKGKNLRADYSVIYKINYFLSFSPDCKCSFQECGEKCDCCTHCKCINKVSHTHHDNCPKGHCHDSEGHKHDHSHDHSHCQEGEHSHDHGEGHHTHGESHHGHGEKHHHH